VIDVAAKEMYGTVDEEHVDATWMIAEEVVEGAIPVCGVVDRPIVDEYDAGGR
jgi:hypothetical protein